MVNEIPFGAAMNKALQTDMEQTHVKGNTGPLSAKTEAGEIDPSFVITHRINRRRATGL